MPQFAETCKADVVEVARSTQGTTTAKLLAILMAAGITDNKELAEITGLSLRSIQHARATHCAQPIAQRNPLRATHCAEAQPIASGAQSIALARDLQRAHANMESPTEILISVEVDSPLAPQAVIEAPVVVPQAARPKSRDRGSRLDPGWQLPHDWREWARTIYPGASVEQIDDQAAQFRDYWIAKPGAQACKLDWEATWRNWCRRGLSPLGNVCKPQHTGAWHRPKVDLVAAYGLTLVDCEPGVAA